MELKRVKVAGPNGVNSLSVHVTKYQACRPASPPTPRNVIIRIFLQKWKDEYLTWNASEYEDVSAIRIPADKIWNQT